MNVYYATIDFMASYYGNHQADIYKNKYIFIYF